MSRGGYKIHRAGNEEVDSGDRVNWIENYLSKVKHSTQSAVEAARQRDSSYFDQLQHLLGPNKGKTVESVVAEMQERTGLKQYLLQLNTKTAQLAGTDPRVSEPAPNLPTIPTPAPDAQGDTTNNTDIFAGLDQKLRESIINLIKNKIQTSHGQTSIPAIQHDILSTFQNQGVSSQEVSSPEVARFISNQVLLEIKNNSKAPVSSNIGKGVGAEKEDTNDADNDFFSGLMPVNK